MVLIKENFVIQGRSPQPRLVLPRQRRHGLAVLYLSFALTTILLMISLSFDYARVQLAKTQLRLATDAAARYAASGLSDGTYYTKACAVATLNTVNGTPLVLQNGDVVIGNYSSGVFTPGGTPTNSVKISAQRSAARGTAIPVLFAPSFASCNVTATSVALGTSGGYGVVAISAANINNAITIDSYNSAQGTYAATSGSSATFANGGSWNLSTTANIKGSIYYSGTMPTNGTVTGGRIALPVSPSLSSQYPLITVPNGTTNSGNYNGGNLTLAAGNYWYTSFGQNSSDTLTINGSVNLYVSGNINLNGTITDGAKPTNLHVYNTVAAGVNITNNGSIYAIIYAPSSPINLNGSMNFYGTMVGSQFSSSGGQSLHIDQSQSSSVISTVQ